jgi:hypothetical protein
LQNKPKLDEFTRLGGQACLLLMALAAPLSIAATQTAWALAIFVWIIRLFVVRPRVSTAAFDIAVLAFVGLTLASSMFSYEPEISLRKMVPVSLVTIAYLAALYIPDLKFLRRLVAILLIGGVISVVYTLGWLAAGKNLKLVKLDAASPLLTIKYAENDTILRANDADVNSPEELAAIAATVPAGGKLKLLVYRHEALMEGHLPIDSLLARGDAAGKFGILDWARGRDRRASGFFGHYTTYAEAIQLLLSVAFGLLVAAPAGFSRLRVVLAVTVALLSLALFLTVTRASWAGFAVSAAIIVFFSASRKTILICALLAVPLAAAGFIYLAAKRNVSMVDAKDGSTTWRLTVWGEALGVIASNPRHMLVGVGMDSIKTRWPEWQMFDNGKLPLGHMHSTPIQFAFERGIPVLIAWIVWMMIYLKLMWRCIHDGSLEWPERGLMIGIFAGTFGFLLSGLVHYNWGDSEVVMIFYLLMGLSLSIIGRGPKPQPAVV